MVFTSLVTGILGIILTFAPEETAGFCGIQNSHFVIFQLLGALYCGFAVINWMAKDNLIGGIYNRPVCLGNLTHFLIGGLGLLKFSLHNNKIIILAVMYILFAVLFSYLLFTTPKMKNKNA